MIIALKNTGMTIEEIKAYTDLILQGDETLDARKDFLSAHKMKVEKSVLRDYIVSAGKSLDYLWMLYRLWASHREACD
ncbi:hypothetical protein D3C76_187800 [compost metagenome]